MELCKKCPKRGTCTELCEEAEKYVNQDFVSQSESVRKLDNIDFKPWPVINKSKKRIIYELYFLDRKSVDEIQYHINVHESYIYKVVRKLRNNISKYTDGKIKDVLTMHFIEGWSLSEIYDFYDSDENIFHYVSDYLYENRVR